MKKFMAVLLTILMALNAFSGIIYASDSQVEFEESKLCIKGTIKGDAKEVTLMIKGIEGVPEGKSDIKYIYQAPVGSAGNYEFSIPVKSGENPLNYTYTLNLNGKVVNETISSIYSIRDITNISSSISSTDSEATVTAVINSFYDSLNISYDMKIILAFYNKEDILIDCKVSDFDDLLIDSFNNTASVTATKPAETITVKGFVFENLTNLFPLTTMKESTKTPVIIRVSDDVEPGEVFNIYGEGLNANSKVKVDYLNSTTASTYPTQTATEISATYVDSDGRYASYILPENLNRGVYALWAANGSGWSSPFVVNKARTLYLSTDQIAAGNEVYVIGRNFDLTEIGATCNTKVRLSNRDGAYEAIINDINPYGIKFTVDESVPVGNYDVSVSNDGVLYSESEEGIQLTVKSKSTDPYNLGVAWASEFNWDNVVNVKDAAYGAKGNGATYDTNAIQRAINATANAGGGVVYLPEGTYLTEALTLPGHVVLAGESKEKTSIVYRKRFLTGSASNVIIINSDTSKRGAEGRQGIANLTLKCDTSVGNTYAPFLYFNLGDGSASEDSNSRTAKYVFVKNCVIGSPSTSWENMSESTFWPTYCMAKVDEHFLVEDSEFLGDKCDITSTVISKYYSVKNNTFDNFSGNTYIRGENSIFDNNIIKNAPWDVAKNLETNARQGIYTSNNSYVANNRIINTGTLKGDGEIIATEGYMAGTGMFGNVVSAMGNVLEIAPKKNSSGNEIYPDASWISDPWDFTKKTYGNWNVMIVDGKGIGQTRAIISSDKTSSTLTIDKPWDIVPDNTSKFTIYLPVNNLTVYNNYMENGSWAILNYGTSYDTVINDNTGVNVGGIDFTSLLLENKQWFHYFARCENNSFDGYSWKNGICGINLISRWESGEIHGKNFYGFDISDNIFEGDSRDGEYVRQNTANLTEQGASSQYYGTFNGISINAGNRFKLEPYNEKNVQAITIQDNSFKNFDRGITLGGDSYHLDNDVNQNSYYSTSKTKGIVIKGNVFDNVTQPYVRYNDTNTVIVE